MSRHPILYSEVPCLLAKHSHVDELNKERQQEEEEDEDGGVTSLLSTLLLFCLHVSAVISVQTSVEVCVCM